MRYSLILLMFIGLALAPVPALAQQPSVVICVIEKSSGTLRDVGMTKTVMSGALSSKGWNVIDINEYPLSASGEDLNAYLYGRDGKRGEYSSSSVSAHISAKGDVALDTKNVWSLTDRDLHGLKWRIDLDKAQSTATAAGGKYLIYGEIDTKEIPRKDLPEGFASEGYYSVVALANLRLVDTASRATLATFVDQVTAMQLSKDVAEMNAIRGVGQKAGEYFAKQVNVPQAPAAPAQPR